MVEETEGEGEEEEEEGLEYATDTPSGGSYMTPPSTGTGGKGSITQWVHAEYIVGSETIHPPLPSR